MSILTQSLHQAITAHLSIDSQESFESRYDVYEIEAESEVLRGYNWSVRFVSYDEIELGDILDCDASLTLKDHQHHFGSRTIHGKISKASTSGMVAKKYLYTIEITDPLYYLSLNRRYEIYQEMSAPEIIQTILQRYSELLGIQTTLKIDPASFPKRHTTTQYAQSDRAFIQMLCEEEGLVVLFDNSKKEIEITLCYLNDHAPHISQTIEATFNTHQSMRAAKQIQTHYESKTPSLKYSVTSTPQSHTPKNTTTTQLEQTLTQTKLRHRLEKLEESLYKDLKRYSDIDSTRQSTQTTTITAHSHSPFLDAGCYVTIDDLKTHTSKDILTLTATIHAHFPNALAEHIQENLHTTQPQYEVQVTAIPQEQPYTPPVTIEKPSIHSILTAIVTGEEKETLQHANEIDVNEYGDIRVLFHFDSNYPVSCYIPLATTFAGDGYGNRFLPRVNSEVVVNFLDGDIDRPIITAALHNGENRQPYPLPHSKTRSFIKTQTTPQYEDKEGYNELLFEDKQGEELLSLRAQNDYTLEVLHNSHTHIHNDTNTVIDNDKEITVANDYTQSVGNDTRIHTSGSKIESVEKEHILSVKEDQELHLLKDNTTIVGQTDTTIVEKDLIQRIKGSATHYIEQDQKAKYLNNLFIQVGKELGIQTTQAYHLNAQSIKESANTITLEATDGISLKCGGNVLTVDASGIHLKAATVDTNSPNGGVSAKEVTHPTIDKPLYNKLRVTALKAKVTKQTELSQTLTYTATVEKFENGVWKQTTQLTPAQEAQINWYFIKNNDQNDTDIITDNPTDDTINIQGLTMQVTLEPHNIYKYGHAHAFVADSEEENGYAVTELKRDVQVEEILGKNLLQPEDTKVTYRVKLNVENPTQEEIKELSAKIEEKDTQGSVTTHNQPLKDDLTIEHTLPQSQNDAPKVVELTVKAFPKEQPERYEEITTYIRELQQEDIVINQRADDTSEEYVHTISDDTYIIKADTSLPEGTEVTTLLHIMAKDNSVMTTQKKQTYVQNQVIEQKFHLDEIIKQHKFNKADIKSFQGVIECQR